MKPSTAFRVAAALAFLGVALGAFGAHALDAQLKIFGNHEIWRTASFYHLIHAVALLVISREYARFRFVWWGFSLGILLFSGSLYILALTNIKKLGMVTPFGGLCFLAGWALLVVANGHPESLNRENNKEPK